MKFSISNHKDRLLPVCKAILLIAILTTFNFLYGFADYSQDAPPIREWDTASFYIGEAFVWAITFVVLYLVESSLFYRHAWRYLAYFFSIRLLFEVYAVIFGADINAKYVAATLFYVTLVIIFYLALSYRKEPTTKTKVT